MCKSGDLSHALELVRYSCEYCDLKACQTIHLLCHVQYIHNRFKLICEYCNFKAATTVNLYKHVQSIHNMMFKTIQKPPLSLTYTIKGRHMCYMLPEIAVSYTHLTLPTIYSV